MIRTVADWMRSVKKEEKLAGLVVDGDGIHAITENEDILKPNATSTSSSSPASHFHAHTILTPNAMEFRRLWMKFHSDEKPPEFNVPIEEHQDFVKQRQYNWSRHR